jgi:hypothetical protein
VQPPEFSLPRPNVHGSRHSVVLVTKDRMRLREMRCHRPVRVFKHDQRDEAPQSRRP